MEGNAKKRRTIEIVIAIILTTALLVTIPVFAWFTNQRNMAKLAKIKAPDDLYINAAHREDKIHLDMRTVNVSKKYKTTETDENNEEVEVEKPVTSQNFVFSVSGNYVRSFTLQMEHTTNNPFTYKIYEGIIYKVVKDNEGNVVSITNIKTGKSITDSTEHPDYDTLNSDGSPKYVEYIATNDWDALEVTKVTFPNDFEPVSVSAGDTLYIYVGDELTNLSGDKGGYLNKADGARIANGSLTDKSYDEYTNFNIYADPLFWQLKNVKGGETKSQPFYNTYVINVSWDPSINMSLYDKETDIIYISAFVE